MQTNGILYNNIVETVGRTPLVKLNRVTRGLEATIAIKCEYFNPLGSVKDRIGMSMIAAAEKEGILNENTVIVEPTSGNTGIAYAMVGAAKGYRVQLVMPANVSSERKELVHAYGAEIVYSDAMEGSDGAIRMARSTTCSTSALSSRALPANPHAPSTITLTPKPSLASSETAASWPFLTMMSCVTCSSRRTSA